MNSWRAPPTASFPSRTPPTPSLHGEVDTIANSAEVFDPVTGRATTILVTVTMKVRLEDRATGNVLYHNDNFVFREPYEISADVKSFFEEESPALDRLSQGFCPATGFRRSGAVLMPAISPEALVERLVAGKPVPAVLLLGEDSYLRETCRDQIVDVVVEPSARDWALARFSADEDDLSIALGQARTVPMLARRQVVIDH